MSKYFDDSEKRLARLEYGIPFEEMIKYNSLGEVKAAYKARIKIITAIQYELGAHRRGSLGEDQESILI